MIISRTPFRISLFGGGTDYPAWYREHGGATIGMTINKYCYITLRHLPPFFEHRHRIVYSHIELVGDVAEIRHPAVRAVFQELRITRGLEVHHDGDLPARSGLGSSSSFTVGLLNALRALHGQMMSKRRLAEEAIRIEQEVIGENVGSQDQVWAAYGGLNRIEFRTDDSFDVQPLVLPGPRREALGGSLMLFFTGLSRNASEIAAQQVSNIPRRAPALEQMRALVDDAHEILQSPERDLDELGAMLHETWQLKRSLASNVSTDLIDEIYGAARDAGALGGKLLGAGGGGFILFYVRPEQRRAVREALRGLIRVPFEIGSEGSRIILFEPEDDAPA